MSFVRSKRESSRRLQPRYVLLLLALSSCSDSSVGQQHDASFGQDAAQQNAQQSPILDAGAIDGSVDDRISCDMFDQTSCETGACDYLAESLPVVESFCRDATPGAMESSSCNRATDCAAGYSCFQPGQCKQYCEVDEDCDGEVCLGTIFDPNNTQSRIKFKVCTVRCAPELAVENNCPEGFACRVFRYNGDQREPFMMTECEPAPENLAGHNEACQQSTDCQSGLACFSVNDEKMCKPLCIYPGGDCASGACREIAGSGLAVRDTVFGVCE